MGRFQRPYEDDCSRADITRYPITAWHTSKESLEGMQAEEKMLQTKLKLFFQKHQVHCGFTMEHVMAWLNSAQDIFM